MSENASDAYPDPTEGMAKGQSYSIREGLHEAVKVWAKKQGTRPSRVLNDLFLQWLKETGYPGFRD